MFQIAIVFILLFSGFLALSVNYSRAFKVKNELINIVERQEGIRLKARDEINAYFNEVGHFVKGPCPEGYTAFEEDGTSFTNRGIYCAKKMCETSAADVTSGLFKAHYKVVVFFKFDLPIFGDLFTFRVEGETKTIFNAPKDDNEDMACS